MLGARSLAHRIHRLTERVDEGARAHAPDPPEGTVAQRLAVDVGLALQDEHATGAHGPAARRRKCRALAAGAWPATSKMA